MKKIISTFLLVGILAITSKSIAQPAVAKMSLDAGTLDKAKEQIDKACANEKHMAKAKTWLYKGMIYAAIANDQTNIYKKMDDGTFAITAYEAFEKALQLEPSNKEAEKEKTTNLYNALLSTAIGTLNDGNKAIRESKEEEGKKLLTTSLKNAELAAKINSKDTLADFLVFNSSYTVKNFEAFKTSTQRLIDNPNAKDKAIYCEYLAFYYYTEAKDETKALQMAQKGLTYGGSEQMRRLVVELLNKVGNIDEAIVEAKKSIQQNPKDAVSYLNLGILLEKAQKQEEAIAMYEKSIEISNTREAIYNLGGIYVKRGADIQKVVNAMSLEEYNKKGKAEDKRANEQFQKALPYFEKLYKMDTKDKVVLDALVELYRHMKDNVDKSHTSKWEQLKKEREALGD